MFAQSLRNSRAGQICITIRADPLYDLYIIHTVTSGPHRGPAVRDVPAPLHRPVEEQQNIQLCRSSSVLLLLNTDVNLRAKVLDIRCDSELEPREEIQILVTAPLRGSVAD